MGIFDLFCSCNLEFDPMTFVHELDPYSLEIYCVCKYELPTLRVLKVIVGQTDRQTNRQTDRQTRPQLYPTPLRGWSKIIGTLSSIHLVVYDYYRQ